MPQKCVDFFYKIHFVITKTLHPFLSSDQKLIEVVFSRDEKNS